MQIAAVGADASGKAGEAKVKYPKRDDKTSEEVGDVYEKRKGRSTASCRKRGGRKEPDDDDYNEVSQSSKPSSDLKCKTKTAKNAGTGRSPSDSRDFWLTRYEELVAYKIEKGDCDVPRRSKKNPLLSAWVRNQRAQYKLLKGGNKSSMTKERLKKLESIGFDWHLSPLQVFWTDMIKSLESFKAETGHCNVPQNFSKNPKLGTWVSCQRTKFNLLMDGKKSSMTEERMRQLNKIGFDWGSHNYDAWGEMYKVLHLYKEKHGDCNVPFVENQKLCRWVQRQRAHFKLLKCGKKSHMTEEKIAKLNKIGFKW